MGWVGFTIYKILEVELGIILSSNLIQLNPWTPLVIIEFNLGVFLCIILRKDHYSYQCISPYLCFECLTRWARYSFKSRTRLAVDLGLGWFGIWTGSGWKKNNNKKNLTDPVKNLGWSAYPSLTHQNPAIKPLTFFC